MPPRFADWTNDQWAKHVREVEETYDSLADVPNKDALGPEETALLIDHTLLKLDATEEQIDELCEQAKQYGFKSVCVRVNFAERAVQRLRGSAPVVACVVGFHEGNQSLAQKTDELEKAKQAGIQEADIVLNRTYIQQHEPDYRAVFDELNSLRCQAPSQTLKLILETSQLSKSQVVAATALAHHANFDFVKTSTGFCGRGASTEDVRLMKSVAHHLNHMMPNRHQKPLYVKASGGIRTYGDVVEMVKAGADRIGASAGVNIVVQAQSGNSALSKPAESSQGAY